MVRFALAAFLLLSSGAVLAAQQPAAHGLTPGRSLAPGESLTSPNGKCRLEMQTDGNLVWRFSTRILWHTGTCGNDGAFCEMQTDGNFVLYSRDRGVLWSSRTSDMQDVGLTCQDDGNLVLYQNSTPVWDSRKSKTSINVQFTREWSPIATGSAYYLCINGQDVVVNNSLSGPSTVKVPCDHVHYGRNEVRIYTDPPEKQDRTPLYSDPSGKTGDVKYFTVNCPSQTLEVKAVANTFRKQNTFEVSNETNGDASQEELIAVQFEREMKGRLNRATDWQKVPPPGSSVFYRDAITEAKRFSISEEWHGRAEVKARVIGLLSEKVSVELQGALRTEYRRQTTRVIEQSVTQDRGVTFQTPPSNSPSFVRFKRMDQYGVGKAVLLIDGLLVHDVPIEVREDWTIEIETK